MLKDVIIEDKLCEFIRGFADDLCSLELLLLFARHPNTRFNRAAIVQSPSLRRLDAEMALRHLTGKGLVVAWGENGTTLFSLTKDQPQHSLVTSLLDIDQPEWQRMLTEILQTNGI